MNDQEYIEVAYINLNQPEPKKYISLRLDEVRKKREIQLGEKITWQRVSKDTGLAYTTVLRYAKNHVDRYDSKTMGTLSQYFDVTLEELLKHE